MPCPTGFQLSPILLPAFQHYTRHHGEWRHLSRVRFCRESASGSERCILLSQRHLFFIIFGVRKRWVCLLLAQGVCAGKHSARFLVRPTRGPRETECGCPVPVRVVREYLSVADLVGATAR